MLTINKECDVGIPSQVLTCTADCMLKGSSECANDGCVRYVLEIVSIDERTLVMKVRDRYVDYVEYNIKSDIIYDDSSISSKMLFCSLLFPDITDSETSCSFDGTTSEVKIYPSRATFDKLSNMVSTKVNTNLIEHRRKFLSSIAYVISDTLNITVSPSHRSSSIFIKNQATHSNQNDIILEYEIIVYSLNAISRSWSVGSYKVSGVEDSVKKTNANNGLGTGNGDQILKGLLSNGDEILINLSVTLEDNSVKQISKLLTVTSKPNFLSRLDSEIVKFKLEHPVVLLYDVLIPSIASSDIVITSSHPSVLSSDFKLTIYPENKKLLIQFVPRDGYTTYNLTVSHTSNTYSPVQITLIKADQPLYSNIITPKVGALTSYHSYWISSGPNDLIVQSVLLQASTTSKLYQSSPGPANYSHILPFSLTPGDKILMIITKRTTDNRQSFYKFDLSVSAGVPTHRSDLLLGTTHRDGSCLHSSNSPIQIGLSRPDFIQIASPSSPPGTYHHLHQYSFSNKSVVLTAINLKNKVSISPEAYNLEPNRSSVRVDTEYGYFTVQGDQMAYRMTINYYNPIIPVSSCTEALSSDPSSHTFEVTVSLPTGGSDFNQFNKNDKTQYWYRYRLSNRMPVNASYMGVFIASNERFVVFKVQEGLFNSSFFPANGKGNSVKGYVFDHNSWTETPSIDLVLAYSKTQASISTYIDYIEAISTSDKNILVEYNMMAYHTSQAYIYCRLNLQSCSQPLRALFNYSSTLFSLFNTYWTAVPDKDSIQDYHSSILKNSLLQAVSVNPSSFDDTRIVQLSQEIDRETSILFDFANAARVGITRGDYQLIERLKPKKTITLLNLDLLISTASHVLQMFTKSFSGFSNATQVKDTLNKEYAKILAMNELKLLRYSHISDTIFAQNEVVKVGGVTLVSPIEQKYTVHLGTDLSVEIIGLEFDPPLVKNNNSRNSMS